MSVIVETSEREAKEIYQTHYYKASYDQIKEAYIKIIEGLKHTVLSVNDDYSEIFSEIPHMTVTAKVIMQTPKETSIDFYIAAEYLVGTRNKVNAFINTVHKELAKQYEFKGVALHK